MKFMCAKASLMKEYIFSTVNKLGASMVNMIKQYPILSFISAFGSVAIFIKVGLSMFSARDQSNPKMRAPKVRRVPVNRKDYTHGTLSSVHAQDQDVGAYNVSKKVMDKNVMILSLPGSDIDTKSGLVIGLKGNICMLPLHYFTKIKKNLSRGFYGEHDDIHFYHRNGHLFRTISVKQLLDKTRHELPDKDMCLFSLDAGANMFADIVKHFVDDKDLTLYETAHCTLFGVDSIMDSDPVATPVLAEKMMHRLDYYSECGEKFCTKSAFAYSATTTFGDCGSLLFHDNSTLHEGLILGVHVAGTNNPLPFFDDKGYATIITRQEIEKALEKFNSVDTQGPTFDPDIVAECEETQLYGCYPVIGKSKLDVNIPSKTSLLKVDELYECLGPSTKKPAPLKPFKNAQGERIDPMKNAVTKYFGDQVYLNDTLVQLCAQDAFNNIEKHSKHDVDRKILTFEEAVAGIHEEQFLDGIPRGTSPGFPKIKQKPPGSKGKKGWFGENHDYEFTSEACRELKKEVTELIDAAKKGERKSNIFMDCLKDELRPNEKADSGKTRLISAAPMSYTIAVRMYFLTFCQWIMKNRINNGMAVGVNPYSEEWHKLAQQLQQVGNMMIAGDYRGYDSTEAMQIGREILKFINRWYNDGPVNALIREILFLDVFSSIHIAGSIVYQWVKALPSGHPLTTIINSLYGKILLRMAFVNCAGRSFGALALYERNVREMIYGDDNIVSMSPLVQPYFNMETISEAIKEFGMEYTDETKSGLMHSFRPLEELGFLKRSFVFDERAGRYIAPLDWETVRQMTYYTRKNADYNGTVIQGFQSFFRELSLHTEDRYDETLKVIKPIMEEKFGYYLPVTDFKLARDIVLDSELRF